MSKQKNARIDDIINLDNSSRTIFKLVNNQWKSSSSGCEWYTTVSVTGFSVQSSQRVRQSCESSRQLCPKTTRPWTIREGWAAHFKKLATPLESEYFDKNYKELVDFGVSAITRLCETEDRPVFP